MSDIKNMVLKAWNQHKSNFSYHKKDTSKFLCFLSMNKINETQENYTYDWKMIYFNKETEQLSGGYGLSIIGKEKKSLTEHLNVFSKDLIEWKPDRLLSFFGLIPNGKNVELAEESIGYFLDSIKNKHARSLVPKKDMIENEKHRINKEGLEAFYDYIDIRSLEALKRVEKFQWKDYSFYAGDGEIKDIRRQASSSFPLLATLFSSRFSLRNAIDNQESLQKALIQTFGVDDNNNNILSKGVVKRLVGLDYSLNGLPIEKLILSLSQIPPDWFPKDEKDWNAFCDITETVGTKIPLIINVDMPTLYNGCQGKWAEYMERLCIISTDTRPPEGMTENDLILLEKFISKDIFKNMPKDKIEASAIQLTQSLSNLPEGIENTNEENPDYEIGQILPFGVSKESVIDWYMRLYNPTISKDKLLSACVNTEQMISAFADKVVLPLAMNRTNLQVSLVNTMSRIDAQEVASQVLFDKMSASSIFENSQSFINRATEILNAGTDNLNDEEKIRRMEISRAMKAASLKTKLGLPPEPVKDSWAPLIDIVKSPNDVYIVPLTDKLLLRDEGKAGINPDGTRGLSICVGSSSYDVRCQKDGHHILSMRLLKEDGGEGNFERLACIEVGKISPNTPLKIHQFYYKNNTKPGPRAQAAMEWFKNQVETGKIPLNFDGIKSFLQSKDKGSDVTQNICGYDWRKRDYIFNAMKPWGRFVGKQYRKMNVDSFAQSDIIISLSKKISPTVKLYDNNHEIVTKIGM